MKREKTVDNIGFVSCFRLNAFPGFNIQRHEMFFVSPFECTGRPAQADEFWLEMDIHEIEFQSVLSELEKIVKKCNGDTRTRFVEYNGEIFYHSSACITNEYKMKCIFYINAAPLENGNESYTLSRNFMVKVDLYHEWRDVKEIDRFELIDLEE